MRHACLVVLALVLGSAEAAATDAPETGAIVATATGQRLTPDELAARLTAADVAILGEIHDNPVHHRRQAWLIDRLDPAGIAFEMVPEAAEAALAALPDDPQARLEHLPEALAWERSGWPDWSLYRPVFQAAGDALLTGGGVGRDALNRAMTEGAAAAHGPDAQAAGLTEALPPEAQAALESEMAAAHCDALPPAMLPGMVEAQRLRDARLAAAALRALAAGDRAVLVTGNGHARTDRGVPRYLDRLAPHARVLSLGQIETAAAEPADGAADLPYDFVWYSEPAERDDACAAFTKEQAG